MRNRLGKLLLLVGSTLVAFCLMEASLQLLLSHPRMARALGLLERMRWLYMGLDRTLPQFDPACAQYDAGLFYTLKPGRCVYSGREFSNVFRINSLGVRDDEEALRAPELVAAGDSYTMGWGVDQDARYTSLLRGIRVLNTGIASYGTAREMRLLDRVDFSKVKYIVIQYDENDFHENAFFRETHDQLTDHDRAYYDGIVRHETEYHRYYWGKYTVELFREAFSAHADGGGGPVSNLDRSLAPELFLHALQYASHQKLDGVQLIVWMSRRNPEFLNAVNELRTKAEYPAFIRDMQILDIPFTADDYYILDDHLNAHGHATVAREVQRFLAK